MASNPSSVLPTSLVLPDVLSPSHSHKTSAFTTTHQHFYKKSFPVVNADRPELSPYAGRKGRGSPIVRQKPVPGPKKPHNHTATCSPPTSPTSFLPPSFPSSPHYSTKLSTYQSLFQSIVTHNPSCAPHLEKLRAGYESLLREREMETLSTVKRQEECWGEGLEAGLVRENRELARECEELETKVREGLRENGRLRKAVEFSRKHAGNSSPSKSTLSPHAMSETVPFAFLFPPPSLPKLHSKPANHPFPPSSFI